VCPPDSSSGTKNLPHYVVKVMDTEGTISFTAVTADEYKKLKEDLQADYVAKGKTWLAAKKKAEAAGEEFKEPQPVKPRYKALDKMSTQTNAARLAKKYQEKHEADQKAKEKQKGGEETT